MPVSRWNALIGYLELLSKSGRLANDPATHPRQIQPRTQQLRGERRNVKPGAGQVRKPVQVAGVFFVMMRRDNGTNASGRNAPEMPRERSPHPWRAGVYSDTIVNDGPETFAKD